MPYRVIIAGDRNFTDYRRLRAECDRALACKAAGIVILSGAALGADVLGERYAAERGLACVRYPADWSKGRKAGPLRNEQMADDADALILFDGGGPGSKSMLRIARRKGLVVAVVRLKAEGQQ